MKKKIEAITGKKVTFVRHIIAEPNLFHEKKYLVDLYRLSDGKYAVFEPWSGVKIGVGEDYDPNKVYWNPYLKAGLGA